MVSKKHCRRVVSSRSNSKIIPSLLPRTAEDTSATRYEHCRARAPGSPPPMPNAGDARNRHAAKPWKGTTHEFNGKAEEVRTGRSALGVTRMQASMPQAPAVMYILQHSIEAFHEACHAVTAVLVDLHVNFVDLRLRTSASPSVPVGYVSTGFTSYDKAVTNCDLIKCALSEIAPASWLTLTSTQMMEPSTTSRSCRRLTVFSRSEGVEPYLRSVSRNVVRGGDADIGVCHSRHLCCC